MANYSIDDTSKSVSFYVDDQSIDMEIKYLFDYLKKNLSPMNKQGPMSGRCIQQTKQMVTFLRNNFHFENLPNQYIVPGVQAFRLRRSLSMFDRNTILHFPDADSEYRFSMTIDEIRTWQESFVVYIAQDNDLIIEKEFLQRALQGQSNDGAEAFQMKFVVRISTCPILMDFNGRIIERDLNDPSPHRIKLVSVTGIDFAGRQHDVDDPRAYLMNWHHIYVLDPHTHMPITRNGRDFYIAKNAPRARLNTKRLYDDLVRMARVRLRACDLEGIEIVVETGIGLGVFAGREIGIDSQIRSFSARAVKHVLEEDGPNYRSIRAIVFALPIFEIDESTSTYNCFVDTFRRQYHGPIPVLIIDQDMHCLAVAIAQQGFMVSELNPADSHGVFGEYWQNYGPAVEEKLALTTVGLLVQHHLINGRHVLNPNNYHFIDVNKPHITNRSKAPLVMHTKQQRKTLNEKRRSRSQGGIRNLFRQCTYSNTE